VSGEAESPRRSLEPLYGEQPVGDGHRCEPADATAPELPAELQRVVERLRNAAQERAR
jgi:hypothetical protein